MSVALLSPDKLLPVAGIRLAACSVGIYGTDRTDLALIEIAEGSECSAVFTNNAFCAAPVSIAREHLDLANPRYCLINAGNANAGTGTRGYNDAADCCHILAKRSAVSTNSILPFSTGVIGEYLPVDKITSGIPKLYSILDADKWLDAANAMMTTDTIAKGISESIDINGESITITGIAKGSGMICPDMATMLAFIATDAKIDKALLDEILTEAVHHSFNRITVDGDTSTNDACVLIATGKSDATLFTDYDDQNTRQLREAIRKVSIYLAQSIIRDGEGATKFVTLEVTEGRNEEECMNVAYAVAHSPLVKTALFASDPNWGRILAVVGRSGPNELEIAKISIYINGLCIVSKGEKATDYTEPAGQQAMSSDDIHIRISMARGDAKYTVWTSDLSYDYVKINAEYRT